jgi:hypothetical protein
MMALIKVVSKPGEKLTGLQALRRYLDMGDIDGAAELAALFAHGDPDACATPDTMLAECHRLFDKALAL